MTFSTAFSFQQILNRFMLESYQGFMEFMKDAPGEVPLRAASARL
jgi:hypothetical protein